MTFPIVKTKLAAGLLIIDLILTQGCYTEQTNNNRSKLEYSIANLSTLLKPHREPSIEDSLRCRLYFELRNIEESSSSSLLSYKQLIGACYIDTVPRLLIAGISSNQKMSALRLLSAEKEKTGHKYNFNEKHSEDLRGSSVEYMLTRYQPYVYFVLAFIPEQFPDLMDAIQRSSDEELWIQISFTDGGNTNPVPIVFSRTACGCAY